MMQRWSKPQDLLDIKNSSIRYRRSDTSMVCYALGLLNVFRIVIYVYHVVLVEERVARRFSHKRQFCQVDF